MASVQLQMQRVDTRLHIRWHEHRRGEPYIGFLHRVLNKDTPPKLQR